MSDSKGGGRVPSSPTGLYVLGGNDQVRSIATSGGYCRLTIEEGIPRVDCSFYLRCQGEETSPCREEPSIRAACRKQSGEVLAESGELVQGNLF